MNPILLNHHSKKIEELTAHFKTMKREGKNLFSLEYPEGISNTTHNKNYKNQSTRLNFGQFNEIIGIDLEKKSVLAEPRVTMKSLLDFTLPYGLIPAVLPEFKGITVGGAIMGGAAESSSHQWGCFHDTCLSYELINGNGDVVKATPLENSDLFHGIAGSYGSIAALALAEIQLVPVQKDIFLRYHSFSDPLQAIDKMRSLVHSLHPPHFLDGLIFSPDLSVIIEGNLQPFDQADDKGEHFSMKSPLSPWYYQHVKEKGKASKSWLEIMPVEEYLFRYDLGAYWMGAYLFNLSFLKSFIVEGWLGYGNRENDQFDPEQIKTFYLDSEPNLIGRTLFRPFLSSQHLWSLLHHAKRWVQNRSVIQDFCIPENLALDFCRQILIDPAIFPIWICPIKGTDKPQIFSPHRLNATLSGTHFINFGGYGVPKTGESIPATTRKLEKLTAQWGGRKVLYSDSYYTEEEFWHIYSRPLYENLRNQVNAHGVWHEITTKVCR